MNSQLFQASQAHETNFLLAVLNGDICYRTPEIKTSEEPAKSIYLSNKRSAFTGQCKSLLCRLKKEMHAEKQGTERTESTLETNEFLNNCTGPINCVSQHLRLIKE